MIDGDHDGRPNDEREPDRSSEGVDGTGPAFEVFRKRGGVKVEVDRFVLLDARKDSGEHRVADAFGEELVETVRHKLGDEQGEDLTTQAERSSHELEDRVGPVIVEHLDIELVAHERQEPCVLLFLFDEQAKRFDVVGVGDLGRSVEKMGCLLYTSPSPRDRG